MASSTSSTHTYKSGFKAYQRIWTPAQPVQVHLVFLHGFSDRIDHYDAFFTVLTTNYPIRVISWDRRGWGKSVVARSDRGDTGPKEQQMAETNEFINYVVADIPDLKATPLFLMGHSMGGQETAYYMLTASHLAEDARSKFSGFILESPYIGLDPATEPSKLKVFLGKLAASILPHFQIPNPLPSEYLTPDVSVQKMYKDDPLCHNLGTLECFRDMLEREAELQALAKREHPAPHNLDAKLRCPVLWTHGTADKACDFTASKTLCDRVESCDTAPESKVFKAYEGWLHQLHNMPDGKREQYARDVGEWIMSVSARG